MDYNGKVKATAMVRQLAAIAVLPGVVTLIVPIWIARRNGIVFAVAPDAAGLALQACGAAVLALGLALFGASLRQFWTKGRGTLAPWDPPRRFVADGPYRFVRNPMISGVIFVLTAEALLLQSMPHLEWAAAFAASNVIYIPLVEEPMLEARFGDPYREYKRHVRRFLPRLRPWTPR